MIAEVEMDVLPSLRIQFAGKGSVIETVGDPRMAEPVPPRAGCRSRARWPSGGRSPFRHCQHPDIPRPELDLVMGVERFPAQNVARVGGYRHGGGLP